MDLTPQTMAATHNDVGGGNVGFAQSTGRVRPIAPRTQNLVAAAVEGLSYTPLARIVLPWLRIERGILGI